MTILSLPSMEHTFNISVKGKETGKNFSGDFTYVRPTLGKRADIAKMAARLNGDLSSLSPDVKAFNDMLATLFHCIIKSPDWWTESGFGRELYDVNIIESVWLATQNFEQTWNDQVFKEPEKEMKTE